LYLFASEHTHNIAQVFKNNRDRLPERHEYLSMLTAFTTVYDRAYNTGTQMHKKHKKEEEKEKHM